MINKFDQFENHINMSKQETIYKEVETLVRQEKVMEKYYDIKHIPMNEPIFTTSQETDVRELIRDGLDSSEILTIIKQW